MIEAGTDFDSLIIEWGKVVASGLARQRDLKVASFLPLTSWQVVEKSEEEYTQELKTKSKSNSREQSIVLNYTIYEADPTAKIVKKNREIQERNQAQHKQEQQ